MVEMQVSAKTYAALREMSEERGVSITQLIAEMTERMQREDFFRQFNEAYARLREDPEAWAEELAERRLWDCTLMDGLKDEPPWPEDGAAAKETTA